MKFLDHQRKKKYLMENFHFWSCDLEKSADSPFLAQKGLILVTVRARVKLTKFWDHQRKETYLTVNFHFWSCDLEKVPIRFVRRC